MQRTRRVSWPLLVLAVLLAMGGCQAGNEEAGPYPILDSGFPASTIDKLYWLDDDRVIFVSYGPKPKSVQEAEKNPRVPGIYIWDTRTNKVTPYKHSAEDLCFSDGYILYAVTQTPYDPSYRTKWYGGPMGGEKEFSPHSATDRDYLFNPYTCRWVERPEYAQPDIKQFKQPLRDGDGWLIEDPVAKEWIWYRPDGRIVRTGIPHSVLRVEWQEHADAYFFQLMPSGDQVLKTDCIRYWWLKPEGAIQSRCQDIRDVKKIDRRSGVSLYPSKKGMLFGAGNTESHRPGSAGIYELLQGGPRRIANGGLEKTALSPDGCKIAYTHVPFSEARRIGAPGDVILKMFNLCQSN